jgi:hypothetical protein
VFIPNRPPFWHSGFRRLQSDLLGCRPQQFDGVIRVFARQYGFSNAEASHFADLLREFFRVDGSAKQRRRDKAQKAPGKSSR